MWNICVCKMASTYRSLQDQAQSLGNSDLAVSFIVQLLLNVCLTADFFFSSLAAGGRRDTLSLAAPAKEVLAQEELHILALALALLLPGATTQFNW